MLRAAATTCPCGALVRCWPRMGALPPELARERERLFPDVTLDAIDAERHAGFVIERVLEQGTMASVAGTLSLSAPARPLVKVPFSLFIPGSAR